jgi:uncharacterized protein YbcI
MDASTPTRGQLERSLSQQIQALYHDQLGHRPEQVICRLVDNQVMVVAEAAITPPEQLLADAGKTQLAEQVRADLDAALQPQIKALVETVLGVSVMDIIGNAKLETGRTGTIIILEAAPAIRPSVSKSRLKQS